MYAFELFLKLKNAREKYSIILIYIIPLKFWFTLFISNKDDIEKEKDNQGRTLKP